ncbi:pyridoxamine 5'-phosphate oxidase [Alcanivorax marinus]|uniref:Pyridoxine/pyridoxamine 5'-phosphate oxidase n=1 Tax=Alloalcanivorax marinus TaxID=1177169 RepID=A0A9Q3UNB2_9GAMM|nr:pyridoxamine 5'-phosphate oxidase [Alloalcanivorax marinus]MCC4308434.1 pyridoxamine 5'-phosphate oxidase [Alloalcanivorax marinus]
MKDVRQEYHAPGLTDADLLADPVEQARRWVDEAIDADLPLANAMTLATVSAHGRPSSRVVLLKGIEDGGFVFFTHHDSRKGEDIAANPNVSFVMFWGPFDRQLIVNGRAEKLPAQQARDYFATRPRGSQLSAAISPQSRPTTRDQLEADMASLAEQYPEGETIPMPDTWGGYRITPEEIQFWHGRPSRLHDRFRYLKQGTTWTRERLAP